MRHDRRSRKPSWDRPGPAPLPRPAHGEEAVAAYARMVQRRTRRLLPVIAVLVVLRSRNRKNNDQEERS